MSKNLWRTIIWIGLIIFTVKAPVEIATGRWIIGLIDLALAVWYWHMAHKDWREYKALKKQKRNG